MSNLADRIVSLSRSGRWDFTLEEGRGETYYHFRPVLYGHTTYERGSVLAGQSRRVYIDEWETWSDARAAVAAVRKQLKRFRFSDLGDRGGSTHVSLEAMTRHLPDDSE